MTEDQKKWIDNASYMELLKRWRFSIAADTIFQEDTGTYYATVMNQKKSELSPGEQVATSKAIGW